MDPGQCALQKKLILDFIIFRTLFFLGIICIWLIDIKETMYYHHTVIYMIIYHYNNIDNIRYDRYVYIWLYKSKHSTASPPMGALVGSQSNCKHPHLNIFSTSLHDRSFVLETNGSYKYILRFYCSIHILENLWKALQVYYIEIHKK